MSDDPLGLEEKALCQPVKDTKPREVTITSSIERVVNIGNYSAVRFQKTLTTVVTITSPAELQAKSKGLDATCVQLLDEQIAAYVPDQHPIPWQK